MSKSNDGRITTALAISMVLSTVQEMLTLCEKPITLDEVPSLSPEQIAFIVVRSLGTQASDIKGGGGSALELRILNALNTESMRRIKEMTTDRTTDAPQEVKKCSNQDLMQMH